MTTWHAELALDYRHDRGRTLLQRRHSGPLQVQKALYPEGPDLCHTMIIHPPGGIAGGDALTLDIHAHTHAQALITTPGASKWYKANGQPAMQRISLKIDGALEWLPQESIVFNAAEVRSTIDIDLGRDAASLGWDIVALGRAAAGEVFGEGSFAQTIRLRDDGRLQWVERSRIEGGDGLLSSPIGLAGRHVFGCLWAAGPQWSDAQLELLRSDLPADSATAVTRIAPRLLLARVLAYSTPAARNALTTLWKLLRPLVFNGRSAQLPRIWAT